MLKAQVLLLRQPAQWLAFGFGSGLVPRAPGTAGTLVAMVLYGLFLQHWPWPWYAAFWLISALFGIWLCSHVAAELGVHDHPGIVWDEFVGYWLTMALAPPGWCWAMIGFFLFRIFDVAKPWPIGWLDRRIGGGTGIMLDDMLAGVYSAACLLLLTCFF